MKKHYALPRLFLFISIAFFTTVSASASKEQVRFAGYWQGPHPELDHVKFILNIKPSTRGRWTADGFWVDGKIYHSQFSLNVISITDQDIEVDFADWGCVYHGSLGDNGQKIKGEFVCTGEAPDSVTLIRANKSDYFGLYPEHLGTSGEFQYAYTVPSAITDGLPTGNLLDAGLSPVTIEKMVHNMALGKYGRLHSFLIIKNSKLVCEEYFYGFRRDVLHPVESVTKSVTSLLIGMAIDDQKISRVDDRVLNYFPAGDYPGLSSYENLKIEHLLTMTSGLAIDEREMIARPDRLVYLLHRRFKAKPGEQFSYNAGNTELLGAILKSATGLFADVLARERLFKPLHITDFQWHIYKQNGYPLCGGALALLPRDLAKIGMLVLQNGQWEGKQIISRSWIKQSTLGRIETGIDGDRYGYQWWVTTVKSGDRDFDLIWANGLGSQFIFIFPQLDMVIVTTGGNWEGGNNGRSWDIFDLFKAYLHELEVQDESP